MQIFINTSFNEVLRSVLKKHFSGEHTLVFRNELLEEDPLASFAQSEVILGNPPVAWFATPLPYLKFWQLDSAGFDGYRSLSLPSVVVCNLQDYFSIPCAETIVAGIMAFYRNIDQLTLLKAQKNWVGAALRPRLGLLTGKRVVILGAGSIGQAVRKLLMGFDCSVMLVARSQPEAHIHSPEALLEVLPRTDLVINCLPGTAKGFFTETMINALPPHAVFANVGRGTTVDESALIKALEQNRLAGAVLDVTAIEPLPSDHPFWTMPNVILSQHTGGGQATEDEGKAAFFIENFGRFLKGLPLQNQIDLARGY
ncbi:MAG: D-2-hydroxyacid dehydrogenase [Runella sp.]